MKLEDSLKYLAKKYNWNEKTLISEMALLLAYTNSKGVQEFVRSNKKYWEDK